VFPLINCLQKIPCNPCVKICPNNCINIKGDLMNIPEFSGNCTGCSLCVAICPGLAITLIDMRIDKNYPLVTLPCELNCDLILKDNKYDLTDIQGNIIGNGIIESIKENRLFKKTRLVTFKTDKKTALKTAGFQPYKIKRKKEIFYDNTSINTCSDDDKCVICRCERVYKDKLLYLIRSGIKDINQLKAITRVTMGSCQGKTCIPLIENIFKQENILLNEITQNTIRPFFVEIAIKDIAGTKEIA
jgi:Fe-S-cluster-containing hydrogenase component 2